MPPLKVPNAHTAKADAFVFWICLVVGILSIAITSCYVGYKTFSLVRRLIYEWKEDNKLFDVEAQTLACKPVVPDLPLPDCTYQTRSLNKYGEVQRLSLGQPRPASQVSRTLPVPVQAKAISNDNTVKDVSEKECHRCSQGSLVSFAEIGDKVVGRHPSALATYAASPVFVNVASQAKSSYPRPLLLVNAVNFKPPPRQPPPIQPPRPKRFAVKYRLDSEDIPPYEPTTITSGVPF